MAMSPPVLLSGPRGRLPPPILYSLHTMPPPSGIQFFSYGNLPNAVGPDESNFLAGRNVSLPVVHPPNPADGRNLVDSSFTNSMQNLALGLTGLFSRDIAEKINQLRDLTVKLDEAKKEIECLKQELEQIRSDKTRVEEKLEASQIGDTQACECGGDAAMKNEANTLQTQLDASRKEMKQLKWMNMAQEIELNDLKKKLANAQSKINNLLAASSSTKEREGFKDVVGAETMQQRMEAEIEDFHKKAKQEMRGAFMESQKILENELTLAQEANDVLAKKFKELGKKHLYVIEYGGERMYSSFKSQTESFVTQLEMAVAVNMDPGFSKKCQEIIETVRLQVKDIEESQLEFKMTVQVMLERLDKGLAQVSDLNIVPPRPRFEIPPESFDTLLREITGVSSSTEPDANFLLTSGPTGLEHAIKPESSSPPPPWLC